LVSLESGGGVNGDMITGLFGSLGGIPALPLARCRGNSEKWDAVEDPGLVEYAVSECMQCPEFKPCREFALSQPENSLDGVIAGLVFVYASHPSARRSGRVPAWPTVEGLSA
jgi:hypothetical protein